jgi:hypothetical protein
MQQDVDISNILITIIKRKFAQIGIDYSNILHLSLNDIFDLIGARPDDAWIRLVDALIKYGRHIGRTYFDLHDQNFMLRGTTLIINDPW